MDSNGPRAVLLVLVLFLAFPTMVRSADSEPSGSMPSLCTGCELTIGVGGTYHFWGRTRGVVLPVTFVWGGNRYELGVFRMASTQWAESANRPPVHIVAHPYWASSLSRRWQLYGSAPVRVFLGLGFSYKTETDELNSTHWNFAEQLGVRVRLPGASGTLELSLRHWSNAGIKLPNRGQDFATVMYVF